MNSDARPAMPFDPVEEAIFTAASELDDVHARAAFLNRACAHDNALRSRIEKLLQAHERAGAFFTDDPLNLDEAPKTPPPAATPADPIQAAGAIIDRYKLLQKIGEGGMGIVYMAEQQEPVRRRVALKIIKLGMDTASVVARFEAERQALALMDHPNIARILDGGATDTGRPYFVMELVQGVAITEYCDKNHLSISARIQLFLKVCDAVQSAHQKGIIHRDLKPSNIMVTLHDGVPVPKVIDFGVAKATNQELTTKTLFTNYATLIGTPAYMSPEQAEMSGLDIDTRSDIYSLGALLYELLTGTTPFPEQRLRSVGYGEMQRIIGQEEPQRLSTRVSTMEGPARSVVAKNRGAEEVALRKRLSGDLDSIVMKCLEKDRTRRYETASTLAADIQRHLNNEPVVARRPSAIYKIQKFASRNKATVAISVAILLALITAFIISTVSYGREKVARAQAENSRRSETAERQRAQNEATRAETEALRAARFQYASDMNLANQAVEEGNLFRALQILNRHRPSATNALAQDLRGWEWRYLWKQTETEEVATLGVHSNGATTVGFSPDGKIGFSGGKDNVLRLWDMKSLKQIDEFPHDDIVNAGAWSPDGRWLATSTEAHTNAPLRLWDMTTRTQIDLPITNLWLRPNNLVFSPDSKLLAFSGYFKIFILDLAARKPLAEFPATTYWMAPMGLAFSSDGKTLAYAEDEDAEIVLWNVETQKEIRRWRAHDWYITRLFFTDNDRLLVSASSDRSVKVWDLASGTELKKFTYPLGFGPSSLGSPRLSHDGKMIVTAASGAGAKLTIQEIPNGREIRSLRGNTHMVLDAAFSPDGTKLLSAGFEGGVRLWDLTAPSKTDNDRRFSEGHSTMGGGPFNAFAISPEGRHVLTIFTNNTFSLWDIPNFKQSPHYPVPMTNAACAALTTGAQMAAFVGHDGRVIFWDRQTGQTNFFGNTITNHVGRAIFSHDGKRLAVGGNLQIAVADIEQKTWQILPGGEGPAIMSLAFSADAQKLAAGYMRGLVKAWDLADNSERSFHGHNFQVNGVAFLSEQNTLVSVAREIQFWDLATGKSLDTFQPRPALFRTVAVSTDGRRLAVGAADGFITIWDLASKQEVATLASHTRPIMALQFLSDGDTLISVAVDEMRVWRAAPLPESDARGPSQ